MCSSSLDQKLREKKRAGGGVVVHEGSQNYKGGVTTFVVFACVVAAMGGLIFGYDLGISGMLQSYTYFKI